MTRLVAVVVGVAVGCSGATVGPGASTSTSTITSTPTSTAAPVVAPRDAVFDTATPPALRLPENFVPEGYVARLAIDPARPTFAGAIEIRGDVAQPSAVIWLHGKHLTVGRATATRDKTTVPLVVTARGEDLLELRPAAPLPAGHYELALDYTGQVLPAGATAGAFVSTYGADVYLTTQFEATSARLVFPCVDEPGRKVPWQLTLDVPKGQVAVSNTPVARETPLDAGHVRVAFAPTRPLPSYLIAFGVGPYELVDAGHAASGTPLRVIVPRGQAARAAYAAAELPKIVDALAAWTDIPYPYPKLDVLARDAGGAMENAGLIMADTPYVLVDPVHPSAIARHDVIDTIGHEASHQWFGDLVTAAWWDDLWLNESFATFMEDKVLVALEPGWHDGDQHVSRRESAATGDELLSARQIRQPITSEGDIHNAFDSATYAKGGTVLAMFEAHLGPDVFQRGIRAYLRAHADHNATLADVVSALDAASGEHLAPAFASFLDQPGIPELAMSVTCTPDQPARATFTQHRYLAPGTIAPGKEPLWKFPLCVAFETAGHARGETCGWIDQPGTEWPLPGSSCPAWVAPDVGGHAYARVALTEPQLVALRDHAWALLSGPERRGVFESARVGAVAGTLPIALMMSFAPKMLAGDRFLVGDALGDIYTLGYGDGAPFELRDLIPDALLPRAWERWAAIVAPLGKRVGLAPRATDTLDDEIERLDLARTAERTRDPVFARQAVALAAHYRTLAPRIRGHVLGLAVNAEPALATKLRADAFAETDPQLREALFAALGSIRDPARLRAMLDTVLDPRVHARDAVALLEHDPPEPGRAAQSAWIRAHLADIERVIPTVGSEDFPPTVFLAFVLAQSCEAASRDEIAAYVTQHFGSLPSAARPVREAIEQMDQCIAKRKRVEPSLRAWLSAR